MGRTIVVNRRMLYTCRKTDGATGGQEHRRLLLELSSDSYEKRLGFLRIPSHMPLDIIATTLASWSEAKRAPH